MSQLGIPPRAISASAAHAEAMKTLVEVALAGSRLLELVGAPDAANRYASGGAAELIDRKERRSGRQDPAPGPGARP
jgi:hypothetical protein